MTTKVVYSNCLLGLLYLIWRGKVAHIAIVTSPSWVRWHLVGLTVNRHAIHFSRVDDRPSAPILFKGRFVGVAHRDQARALTESGRRVVRIF